MAINTTVRIGNVAFRPTQKIVDVQKPSVISNLARGLFAPKSNIAYPVPINKSILLGRLPAPTPIVNKIAVGKLPSSSTIFSKGSTNLALQPTRRAVTDVFKNSNGLNLPINW